MEEAVRMKLANIPANVWLDTRDRIAKQVNTPWEFEAHFPKLINFPSSWEYCYMPIPVDYSRS